MPHKTPALLPVVLGLLLAGCGDKSSQQPAAEAGGDSIPAATNSAEVESAGLMRTASPEGARVFFISPLDGDSVSNPVKVEFGIEGMAVVKAGEDQPQSGHHHLIVDATLPQVSLPIPANEQYIHFGDASTSTELTLPPGEHTLQLLLGDHLHIPHDPPVSSAVITITVE